ncbi:MAG: hypothetical protein WA058_01955 [Minisyncoccia bacterium]
MSSEFVPKVIFDKTWRDGNFLIPKEIGVRVELLRTLTSHSHYGIMHRPEHKEARLEVEARVAALNAYNAVHMRAKSDE